MSKKSRRPGRRDRKSAGAKVPDRIAANFPATLEAFQDRVLEMVSGFPTPTHIGHLLFTWTPARGIVFADALALVGTQGMDALARYLPQYLRDNQAKAAALASNGWMRGVETENEARLLKRTGLNEPNIERHAAVIVEISNAEQTEEWSAQLRDGRVVGWRKQGEGSLEFTTADDESAIKLVRNAFRSLGRA